MMRILLVVLGACTVGEAPIVVRMEPPDPDDSTAFVVLHDAEGAVVSWGRPQRGLVWFEGPPDTGSVTAIRGGVAITIRVEPGDEIDLTPSSAPRRESNVTIDVPEIAGAHYFANGGRDCYLVSGTTKVTGPCANHDAVLVRAIRDREDVGYAEVSLVQEGSQAHGSVTEWRTDFARASFAAQSPWPDGRVVATISGYHEDRHIFDLAVFPGSQFAVPQLADQVVLDVGAFTSARRVRLVDATEQLPIQPLDLHEEIPHEVVRARLDLGARPTMLWVAEEAPADATFACIGTTSKISQWCAIVDASERTVTFPELPDWITLGSLFLSGVTIVDTSLGSYDDIRRQPRLGIVERDVPAGLRYRASSIGSGIPL